MAAGIDPRGGEPAGGTRRRARAWIVAALVATLAALAIGACWLDTAVRVGTGFTAKVLCSLAHNSGIDPHWALDRYVDREVAPLGPALSIEPGGGDFVARAAGGLVRARAVTRPGLGCVLLTGANPEQALVAPDGVPAERMQLDPNTPWPLGAAPPAAPPPPAVGAAIDRAFAEPDPTGADVRHTTAVVVAHQGRLVAERYRPGIGPDTPLLSWSMAKSVIAAVVAVAAADGRLDLQARAPVPEWAEPGDPRHAITLDQLLRMSSGLAFDETYGPTNDVSIMLFSEPDVGAFAARFPLAAPPDSIWSYSSGSSNIVARIVRDLFPGDLAGLVHFTRQRLLHPAGITSAFFETDVSGTPIGSSFAWMTARDWARFGELHRNDGAWNGERILPEGWVRYVSTPTPKAPEGQYGAHWWLNAGEPDDPSQRPWPTLPTDVYAARGHSGQWVAVVPSAELVVVRLGLSFPDNGNDGAERLIADLIAALAPEAGVAANAAAWPTSDGR